MLCLLSSINIEAHKVHENARWYPLAKMNRRLIVLNKSRHRNFHRHFLFVWHKPFGLCSAEWVFVRFVRCVLRIGKKRSAHKERKKEEKKIESEERTRKPFEKVFRNFWLRLYGPCVRHHESETNQFRSCAFRKVISAFCSRHWPIFSSIRCEGIQMFLVPLVLGGKKSIRIVHLVYGCYYFLSGFFHPSIAFLLNFLSGQKNASAHETFEWIRPYSCLFSCIESAWLIHVYCT